MGVCMSDNGGPMAEALKQASGGGRGRTWVLRVLLCVIAIAGGTAAYAVMATWVCPLKVVIQNRTGSEISQVAIVHSGGANRLSAIASGADAATCVHVRGESSVQVDYVDGNATRHSADLNIYLESGYRGRIVVEIGPDGAKIVENRVKLY